MFYQSFKLRLFLFVFILSSGSNCFSQEHKGQLILSEDGRIEKLLTAKKELNKHARTGYKIQIYSGNRAGAKKAQETFKGVFPDWDSLDQYEPPNFKIWVGDFKNRLTADRALKRVKREFPSAFIFKLKP